MQYIQQPQAIEAKSFDIISEIIAETRPDYRFASPLHEAIIKRVIHTTADFDWLDILWFSPDALIALSEALSRPCTLYTDTTMALSGINKTLLARFGGECRCYISDPRVVREAQSRGMTRSMAAVDIAVQEPGEKVFVFGNAPTALFRLLEHRETAIGGVVGVPVGFVGAAESKAALSESGLLSHRRARPQRGKQRGGSDCERSALPPAGGAMSDQTFDAPVWHHGKALRKGYTTGSCATAAAKVAALMVMRQHLIHQVSIVTPSGVTLCLNVESPHVEGQQAVAAIRKDGGDDVDATHGMLIFARVTLNDSGEISLQGGEGIGTVTRKGIGLPTGSPAINRTPRHTIETAVREAIGPTRGAQVEIFAPEGVLRAQKTYNARLGILGGISIIGTTGIVTPMSEESWKRSLSLELEIKRAAGLERVVLVPGNHGERFVREQMGIDPQMVVTMSNFVGYMIEEAVRLGFRQIVLIGHPGKLIKIAAGIFHTHSHIADARMETLVAHLALLGAPLPLLTLVSECDTTEAAMEHIDAWGYQRLYNHLAERICQRVLEMLRFTQQPPTCDAVLFSFDNQVLGSSRPLEAIARELTC